MEELIKAMSLTYGKSEEWLKNAMDSAINFERDIEIHKLQMEQLEKLSRMNNYYFKLQRRKELNEKRKRTGRKYIRN